MFYTVPGPDVDPRFVHYWALVAPLSVLSTNTAVPSMTSTDLAQLYLAVPPLPIQRAIADYLDRETAEIDDMRADLDEIEQLLETRRDNYWDSARIYPERSLSNCCCCGCDFGKDGSANSERQQRTVGPISACSSHTSARNP